jgi:hypothetical protein
MKEISSMNFPQHAEVFYFYGQALELFMASYIGFGFLMCDQEDDK